MQRSDIKFPKTKDVEIAKELKARVRQYFKEKNISRYGNGTMFIKSLVMLALYLLPYGIMMSGIVTHPLAVLGLWVMMGIGVSGIGLSIMHDANHGAYSKNKRLNTLMCYMLNLVGGDSGNWRIQHNILHHTYTNIEGIDEDISPAKFLRFSPHKKLIKAHRFQFLYAWFFYGLMTLSWVIMKDIRQLVSYNRRGLLSIHNKSFGRLITEVVLTKVIYLAYVLVLPILVLSVPVWVTIVGFIIMHFVAGFILGIIFQPAHVVPAAEYPLPDTDGIMDNNWTIHQLMTTTNFAPGGTIFSWFVGGLNYQIEHHLFPNVCHVHYRKISPIVRQTAEEFGLPYHSEPTFLGAVWNHGKMLYRLGRPQKA